MPSRTLQRDLEVMRAIGRFRMLTRPQVKRWFFGAVSEPIVTRFIDRVTQRDLIGVERLHGNGMQVLWLTRKGRNFLVEHGAPAVDLFTATGPVAAKDFQHTVEIANVALQLATRENPPDELLPAWALQRVFAGKLTVIPDLLGVWRADGGSLGIALAVEVDLGTESLATVFRPKLRDLAAAMDSSFGVHGRILALVPSAARRDSLREMLDCVPVELVVETIGAFVQSVNSKR
jgi:hypothetical protein